LCASGLVLLLRRMGGWHKLAARVRGTLAQRTHVVAGRVVLAVLCLTSLTALTMSASTLGLVALDAGVEPDVVSVACTGQAAGHCPAQLASAARPGGARLAQTELPRPCRPRGHLEGGHHGQGTGWVDRYTGQMLAWQGQCHRGAAGERLGHGAAHRRKRLALGRGAGAGGRQRAAVLGVGRGHVVAGAPLAPHITGNSPLAQADVLIFVASEGGSTWGFAQTLHNALAQAGHRVHTSALENFATTPPRSRCLCWPPPTARARHRPTPATPWRTSPSSAPAPCPRVPVTVLGFGDRQFPAFCAFARRWMQPCAPGLARAAAAGVHPPAIGPAVRALGRCLAQALGQPLVLAHVPRLPPTTRSR
jgi:sulfite reductase (NADPH) flavoprotein alpha-component